jgi:hypothetical protein
MSAITVTNQIHSLTEGRTRPGEIDSAMREMQDCVMQEVRLSQTTKSAFKNHMMVVGEVLSSLAMRKSRIPLTEVSGISTVVHGLVIAGGSV